MFFFFFLDRHHYVKRTKSITGGIAVDREEKKKEDARANTCDSVRRVSGKPYTDSKFLGNFLRVSRRVSVAVSRCVRGAKLRAHAHDSIAVQNCFMYNAKTHLHYRRRGGEEEKIKKKKSDIQVCSHTRAAKDALRGGGGENEREKRRWKKKKSRSEHNWKPVGRASE